MFFAIMYCIDFNTGIQILAVNEIIIVTILCSKVFTPNLAYLPNHFPSLQIGGTYLKPVILPPEVAIGAVGKIQVCT